jgi:hypothetical protein
VVVARAQRDSAKKIIHDTLAEFGLGALADWAWNRFLQTDSIDLVMLDLRDRQEYKDRFAGLLALAQQGIAISEEEQINYERQSAQLMRQAGMPTGFYDNWTDFTDLIKNNVSLAEVSDRINGAYLRVTQAPSEVRRTMGTIYGVEGDAALAAIYLDPGRALPKLMEQVRAAEVGGFLAIQGVQISREAMERLATYGFDTDMTRRLSAQVGALNQSGVFDETINEGQDLTVEREGVGAVFENDAQFAQDVERRIQDRVARTSGSGGPTSTSKGVTGQGAAPRS